MARKNRASEIARLQVAALVLVLAASTAQGAGTTSDTDIDNTATINFEVAGTPQTAVQGSATFKVDNLIDFSVTELDTTYTSVAPGSTFQAVAYTLQNDGNTVQDFSFTAEEVSTGQPDGQGGTDAFNGTAVGIFVEEGTTPGYQQGVDSVQWADELGEDLSIVVYVVRDIGAQADAETSGVILVAQVATGSDPTNQGTDITTDDRLNVDDPNVVEIVFGDGGGPGASDGANDGLHSDTDAFIIRTATLAITKASAVISDPIGVGIPKAIPGATIEYTITVEHTGGSGTATSVTVVDDLSTEVGLGTISFDTAGYGAGFGLQVTAPNLYSGNPTALGNPSGDGDEGIWDAGTNTLTVNGIELDFGETADVNYRVTITP